MAAEELEIGPIDFILVEWPGQQPNGEIAPELAALIDAGTIRVLDLAVFLKNADGSIAALEIEELGGAGERLKAFQGASSGIIHEDDLAAAAEALEPGTSAALLVYENAWAAPFATAVRRSGGQLVAGGRIPVEDVVAALDALEQADSSAV